MLSEAERDMRMKIKVLIAFLTLGAMIASIFSASASAFTWGVCGHQIWSIDTWKDPETQFATMERYGLRTYRFDVPLVDNQPHAVDDVQKLIQLAHKHHITLHPILYVPFTWGNNATDGGRYPATDAGLEEQGYQRVYPFVRRFASQIHDWELENEISLKSGVKKGIGRVAADYETHEAHQWAAVLRGMSKAVHDVRKQTGQPLKTVVDTMYVDFGLIPFLEKNGVSIDKLAYHYYYNVNTTPYKIYAPDGKTTDIFMEMRKLGKPVIINEFNAAEIYAPKTGGKPYNDAQALASLKKHIGYITQQAEANIEGVEYYELYNEPGKDVAESNFGLMTDATHPRTQMFLAAAYACGHLSPAEKGGLIASGLFTATTLAEQLKSCRLVSGQLYSNLPETDGISSNASQTANSSAFQQQIAALKERIQKDSNLPSVQGNRNLIDQLRRIENLVSKAEHQGFLTTAGQSIILQSLERLESNL